MRRNILFALSSLLALVGTSAALAEGDPTQQIYAPGPIEAKLTTGEINPNPARGTVSAARAAAGPLSDAGAAFGQLHWNFPPDRGPIRRNVRYRVSSSIRSIRPWKRMISCLPSSPIRPGVIRFG